MITKQDLEILERLYSPVSRILLEHLRVNHHYPPSSKDPFITVNRQQEERIRILADEVNELTEELTALKSDYEQLRELNNIHCNLIKGMI